MGPREREHGGAQQGQLLGAESNDLEQLSHRETKILPLQKRGSQSERLLLATIQLVRAAAVRKHGQANTAAREDVDRHRWRQRLQDVTRIT